MSEARLAQEETGYHFPLLCRRGQGRYQQLNDAQKMVQEFHEQFEIHVSQTPSTLDKPTQTLRFRLIQEEFEELQEAMQEKDLPAIAKELADLLYVVYGTAVSLGIDMEPVFKEVHRSNISKVGGYKREDGKWVKPPTYSPASLDKILESQAVSKTHLKKQNTQ